MKKISLMILLLFIFTSCIGCEKTSQFSNLEGYTLIYYTRGIASDYGYIKDGDLEKYTNGELVKIKILVPYKGTNEFTIIDANSINSLIVKEWEYDSFVD